MKLPVDLKARAAAWWSAWKWVLLLALLLGLSLWGNLQQYVASKTAPLRADLKVATDTLATVRGLAEDAHKDHVGLVIDLEGISQRGKAWATAYGAIAAKSPLAANCAPGKARMDYVNKDADP